MPETAYCYVVRYRATGLYLRLEDGGTAWWVLGEKPFLPTVFRDYIAARNAVLKFAPASRVDIVPVRTERREEKP